MSNKLVPLVTVCDFEGGSQPPKSEWIKEKKSNYIRMLQIRDFTQDNIQPEYVKKKESMKFCKSDDILIARYGASIGKILTGLEGTYNVALIKTIPNEEKLIKPFLKHFLLSDYFQNFIKNVGTRAAQAGFNKQDLQNVMISVPTIGNQRRICEVLTHAEKLLKNRQFQLKALDELSQSLFLEMFGDPYYNEKDWKMGKILDLTSSSQYGSGAKASEEEKEYPMLRMNNITYEGNWDFNSLKYVDIDSKDLDKYLVSKGQLLFNRTNSVELVGKTAVYREEKPMAYAGYLVRLIPNTNGNSEYISGYLNSKYGKKLLRNMAKSIVGMANINAKELKNIVIPLPPIKLQNEFAEKIQAIEAQKEQLTQSLVQYEELHQSLLQKAFRGELFQDVTN